MIEEKLLKKELREKKKRYANSIQEIYKPKISPEKHLEVEKSKLLFNNPRVGWRRTQLRGGKSPTERSEDGKSVSTRTSRNHADSTENTKIVEGCLSYLDKRSYN